MAIDDNRTRLALAVALVSESLADEVEALIAVPAAPSDELARNMRIAVAEPTASDEVLAALEAGTASLSRKTHNALAIALASKEAALDLFTIA